MTYNSLNSAMISSFSVEIEGINTAEFQKAMGLSEEIITEIVIEGGVNDRAHYLLTPPRATNITLVSGMASIDLWEWWLKTRQGLIIRRSLSIVMYASHSQHELLRWNVKEAVPVRWEGPTLIAGGTQVAVQQLEMIHKGFEISMP